MVQGTHNYSVSVSNGKYVINIANQPQTLLLTLGSDGKASGPAAQDITGQKITGYDVVTNLKTGAQVSKTPIYAPITVHCNVGSLTPGAAVAVDPGLPFASAPTMLSAIGTVLDTLSGDAPKQLMLPPGPRMAGVFTGTGGMKIQFNDGSAIVDCAQAHILTPYSVSLQAGTAVVTVNNGSNPFNLVRAGRRIPERVGDGDHQRQNNDGPEWLGAGLHANERELPIERIAGGKVGSSEPVR